MARITRHIISLLLAFGCVSPSQAVVLALDHTGGNPSRFAVDLTLGWDFTVSSTITVDALGIFDSISVLNGEGLAVDHQVGIWSDPTPAPGDEVLLRTATVTNASTPVASTSTHGRWLFEPIALLELAPGNYVIGATYFAFPNNVDLAVQLSNSTTVAQITYGNTRSSLAGSGLQFPVVPQPFFNDAWFGPNFSVLQVPEPASLALLALGLAGLGFSRRRRLAN